jgi:hypothetical protein
MHEEIFRPKINRTIEDYDLVFNYFRNNSEQKITPNDLYSDFMRWAQAHSTRRIPKRVFLAVAERLFNTLCQHKRYSNTDRGTSLGFYRQSSDKP